MSVVPGPRTRSWEIPRSAMRVAGMYYYADNRVVYQSSIPYDWKVTGNTMHDVVTENFKSRSAKGEIINTPMDKIDYQLTVTPSAYTIIQPASYNPRYYYQGETIWEDVCGLGFLSELESDRAAIDSAVESCLTAAYAKVDSTAAPLIPTLFELRETSHMLNAAARKLLNLHVLLKNYKAQLEFATTWRKLKMVEKTIENTWMEIRLGWKPFLFELGNLHNAMTMVEAFAARQTFRSGVRLTFQGADEPSITLGNEVLTFSRTHLAFVNVSAGVLCHQRYGGVPDTYGLTKFPQAIWELTKLSWCVDYFFNIGELIASFTPDSLWSPLTCWVTVRKRTTDEIRFKTYYQKDYSSSVIPGFTTRKSYEVIRTPNGGRSFLPKLRPRLNWVRKIDSFFVARQLFGNRFMKSVRRAYTTVKKLRKK